MNNYFERLKSSIKNLIKSKSFLTGNSVFQIKLIESLLEHSQNNLTDNFNDFRFPSADKDKYDLELHSYFFRYFSENIGSFERGYNLLSDDRSKELFIKLMVYKILGHKCVQILDDPVEYNKNLELAKNMPAELAKIDLCGTFEKLKRYHLKYNGRDIVLEAQHSNIAYSFFIKQYHFERDGIVIQAEPGDHVIDGGACYLDTAIAFASCVGEKGKVYSFDFFPTHLKAMKNNLHLNPWAEGIVEILPYAIGKQSNNLETFIAESESMNSGASLAWTPEINAAKVPTKCLDDLYNCGKLDRIDFIKLDIEGYEAEALLGAKKTIEKFKPKLAVCIYHLIDDFYKIPELIQEINPNYSFYIEHHTNYGEETILYAVSS